MCTIYNRCSWGSHILNTASAKRYSEDVIFTMLLRTAVLIQLKYFRTSVYSSYIQTSRIGIAKEIFWNRLQARIDKEFFTIARIFGEIVSACKINFEILRFGFQEDHSLTICRQCFVNFRYIQCIIIAIISYRFPRGALGSLRSCSPLNTQK